MSSCMCTFVHLISLTGSMFMNIGVNMMPNENTPTLVINFLHSGTKTPADPRTYWCGSDGSTSHFTTLNGTCYWILEKYVTLVKVIFLQNVKWQHSGFQFYSFKSVVKSLQCLPSSCRPAVNSPVQCNTWFSPCVIRLPVAHGLKLCARELFK